MKQSALKQLVRPLIYLLLKRPKFLIFIPLIGGLWYGYEVFVARPAMAYMGVPQVNATPPQTGIRTGLSHILRNKAYMVEYSESLENPLWVTYKVTKAKYKSGKRPSGFTSDWRSYQQVKHVDYTRSGYDRGHMAPNYVIASRYGVSAQKETFLMTNISPQKPKLNQKSWQRLEEVIANDFSKQNGDFWVTTGPIFDANPKSLKSSNVKIPKAFYKILIKPSTPQTPAKALAFIFPQNAKPNASLMTFTTTIDEVERLTGIDFFADLEDDFEDRLESSNTPEAWHLKDVANRPSRY